MSAPAIEKYAVQGFVVPEPIKSDAQNEVYVSELMTLERKKKLSHEERQFAELLTLLIQDYENKSYEIPHASPRDVLRELMQVNDLKYEDLADVFGSKSVVSEVLNGKRPFTSYVEKLSRRFKVSPALFFERETKHSQAR
ncbi:MAG: hypothetical protein WA823_14990 [Candidatus Acidiferrales bacterium]